MRDLKSLKEQYCELGEEIERLEKCELSHILFLKLYLSGDLVIYFNDSDDSCTPRVIGYVSEYDGSCHMVDRTAYYQNRNIWYSFGMKTDSSVVRFKNNDYSLRTIAGCVVLTSCLSYGSIYNFTDCVAYKDCEDANILRHEHNNRPVLF